eukprot:2141382-Prymnesium_polylepis.1
MNFRISVPSSGTDTWPFSLKRSSGLPRGVLLASSTRPIQKAPTRRGRRRRRERQHDRNGGGRELPPRVGAVRAAHVQLLRWRQLSGQCNWQGGRGRGSRRQDQRPGAAADRGYGRPAHDA